MVRAAAALVLSLALLAACQAPDPYAPPDRDLSGMYLHGQVGTSIGGSFR